MKMIVSFDLTGKVALLTGAGRGIGLAIAQALAGVGTAVAIQDLDLAVAQKEAEAINADGGRAIALGGDVCDLQLAGPMVKQTAQQLGGLHILVNNASVQTHYHWSKMQPSDMQRTLAANWMFPLMLCQAAAPIFKQQRWGRIVNIGSVQQRWPNMHMLDYSTSKEALAHLTRGLSRDLCGDNITVNMISPGWFNTLRNREQLTDAETVQKLGKRVPMGRIGEPADCAGAALLFCSEAGNYITGQTLFIDGGL